MGTPAAFRVGMAIMAAVIGVALSGCAPVNMHGNGFGDESSTWGQKFRPPTQQGNLQGLDTRAREIEQNLGVR